MNDDEMMKQVRDQMSADFAAMLEAAIELKRQYGSSLDTLIKVLQDHSDPVLAWTAAEALGELGDPAAIAPLLTALGQGNSVLKKKAIIALGKLNAMSAIKALIDALDDPDGEVRDAAAWTLLDIGDPQTVQPILSAVVKGNINLEVLRELGETALQPLLDYMSSTDDKIRAGAAIALGELRNPSAVEPLILALQHDPSDEVRSSAAFALGELKDWRSFETLVAALHDPFDLVRGHAVRALGLLNSERALRALNEVAEDKSEVVRTWFKWAIDWYNALNN